MRYIAVFAILLFAAPAYAQLYGMPGTEGAAVIRMSPAQPAPESTAQMTVLSPVLDLERSFISWRLNDKLLAEGRGLTGVSVSIGRVGTTLEISANILTEEGDSALTYFSFTPASVDILWEADGYTPPFYAGRTLPGIGSKLTFVAYTTFMGENGRIPDDQLIYTWKKGETTLGSQSGNGKSAITIQDPLLGEEVISVEVRTQDGSLSARSSVRIPKPTTVLRLYEDHPLYGILFHKAFGATAFTSNTESSFQAIPYFVTSKSLNDTALIYDWRVNRQSIAADTSKPSQITINAEGSTGIALIDLEIGHQSNYFLEGRGAWQVTFSSDATDFSTNPFTATQ